MAPIVSIGLTPKADDLCRLARPENARGFINTERLFLGQ